MKRGEYCGRLVAGDVNSVKILLPEEACSQKTVIWVKSGRSVYVKVTASNLLAVKKTSE